MAEFHGIFCYAFLLSVLLKERVGGMGDMAGWGRMDGVGGGKNHCLGHPWAAITPKQWPITHLWVT